jgi:hypothetical protein
LNEQPNPHTPFFEDAADAVGSVVFEDGQYVVYLDVVLESGGVRRRIGVWRSKADAERAAAEIARNAARHIPAPPAEP